MATNNISTNNIPTTKQIKSSLLSHITQMRLAYKLPLAIAGFALICGAAVAIYSETQLRSSYENSARMEMSLNMEAKSDSFAALLDRIVGDVHSVADNPLIISAAAEFPQAWNDLGENQTKHLQDLYITQNPILLEKNNY